MLRHDGLLNRIIEGRIEGKRGRGRTRQQMIDDIMEVWQLEKNSRGQDEMDRSEKTTEGRHMSRTRYYIADYYKRERLPILLVSSAS